jgi:A/G-specific adenine glycosylase
MSDARALLRWYDARRRDLPWRRSRDPYRIWLSEVMLQQTQVRTVIPYYERFLERFPTVGALAAAETEEVLALWSGLGYYRRARQLHRAAGEVVRRGGFPETALELRELPGVGPYTAAAVASIAFGEPVPVLDGNVERLLCRRLAVAEDPKRSAVRRRLSAAAAELLDPERPGDGNQALMEVGATVCRPVAPDCPDCPLRAGCRARIEGDPERYPAPRRRRRVERVELAVAVAREGGRVLLFRRPEGSDVLAGLWELPNVPRGRTLAATAAALGERYGGRWRLRRRRGRVRHGITYRAITLHLHPAEVDAGDAVAEGPEAAWVGDHERGDFPVSSMVEKVLAALPDPTV